MIYAPNLNNDGVEISKKICDINNIFGSVIFFLDIYLIINFFFTKYKIKKYHQSTSTNI